MKFQSAALVKVLRLQLADQHLDQQQRILLRCQLAKELEASGEFEQACGALADGWRGVGVRPPVEDIEAQGRAELLMRVGALTGRFGKGKGIEGAQESAIDLISEAARTFEELGQPEKVAEAWTEIGFCYWQKGTYQEARIALDNALLLLGDARGEVWAMAVVRKALVENSAERHFDAYQLLREHGNALLANESDQIRGQYHITFANILFYLSRNEAQSRAALGETEEQSFANRAFVEYAAAAFHFEQAGHSRHAARVLNNTGYLLMTRARFDEAHESLDRARAIFRDLEELSSVAQVDETRACVYLAQGKESEAARAASGAVAALARGDDAGQLAQALITQGRALARLERFTEAKETLERGRATALACDDLEEAGQACLTIIEEMADVLAAYEVWSLYEQADELLRESQRPETINRLRACARTTLKIGRRALRTDLEDGWTGCNLADEVGRYEGELIRQALAAEGGSITRAARRLGATHQALRNIINGRQRHLLGKQYAPRPRRPNGRNGSEGRSTSAQVT
jgi:tetratricopeptide (TPR) repeat protein